MTDKQMKAEAGKSYTEEHFKSEMNFCEDALPAFPAYINGDLLMVNMTVTPGPAHAKICIILSEGRKLIS